MAYIIDDTFFQRELEIPNKDEINSKSLTTLNQFIDEKCRLFMRDALGPTLYNQLDALLVNGLLPVTISSIVSEQKWWRLVNGTTYTKDGVTLIWDGLRVVKGSYKTSVLAYYTYYYWLLKNEITYMSGVGEVKGNPKGAVMVNSVRRLTETWNDMVLMNQGSRTGSLPYFEISRLWNTYDWNAWYGSINLFNHSGEANVSLIQYLTDNSIDFPTTYPRCYEIQNQLGL